MNCVGAVVAVNGSVAIVSIWLLAERERKGLDAGVEKLDLESPLTNLAGLSNQLIQALIGGHAVATLVDVGAVRGERRLAVERHAKANRFGPGWPHYQVQIARMKTIDDASGRLAEPGRVAAHRPAAGVRQLPVAPRVRTAKAKIRLGR